MSSAIMLATTLDTSKLTYPAEVSIKLDGVASDFYKTPNGWVAQSRQGKPLPSTAHIVHYLNKRFSDTEVNTHIVGELTVMGVADFKTAGGIIRRKEVATRIILNLYDMYVVGKENEHYETRVARMTDFLKMADTQTIEDNVFYRTIKRVPVAEVVNNVAELQIHLNSVENLLANPLFEGFVIRCMRGPDSRFGVNKRSRGFMRYKPKPTVDLKIVRFEEASANKEMKFLGDVYQEGEGLKAVGRIVALYDGEEIGVGPGCMTHVERRDMWERYQRLVKRGDSLASYNLIAEVEYMLDKTYKALRQPVFKQWRTDKKEPSEVS